MKNLSRVMVVACAALMVAGLSGCGLVNKLRAKNNLNEGVREFNNGKYDLAQDKFASALTLDPDNANAQLFYARAINARFEQTQSPETALKAIDAYQNIINHSGDKPKAVDQALVFQAALYKELAGAAPDKSSEYKDKATAAILKRTELPTATDDSRASAYYTVGHDYWEDSYNLSKPFQKMVGGKFETQQIPPEVADKMRPLLAKAHEYLSKAISLKSDYADAYAIQKLTYIQDMLIESNPANKEQLSKKVTEMNDLAMKAYEQQKAQAAQAATASPSAK